MAQSDHPTMDYPAHERTYSGFLRFSIAGVIACLFILVALLGMTIVGGLAFWVGMLGLIVGFATIAVVLASGLGWTAPLVILAGMVVLTIASL